MARKTSPINKRPQLAEPVTAKFVPRLRGNLKRKLGDPNFAEEMAAYKREEIELEEAKLKRCAIR